MSFASEMQRRKFIKLLDDGVISQEQFDEWDSKTDRKQLPVRVKPKPKSMKPKMAKVIR